MKDSKGQPLSRLKVMKKLWFAERRRKKMDHLAELNEHSTLSPTSVFELQHNKGDIY